MRFLLLALLTLVLVAPVEAAPRAPRRSPAPTPTPLVLPTATPTPTRTLTPAPLPQPSFFLGTLLSDPGRASQEHAAGVTWAELELGWDAYEPGDGVFDATYAAAAKVKLQTFRAAGQQVVLGVGLQYPPAWVFNYPNSRFVNQYGDASGQVNLVFNGVLRGKAEQYISRVMSDLGPQNVAAVRIGSGGNVETLYPDEWIGSHSNSYWAFDANAQGWMPMPGWKPGQTSYNGAPVGVDAVTRWYSAYLDALAGTANWQISTYTQAGFGGWFHILFPGQGVRPLDYRDAMNNYLNGVGDNGTVGRGAAWDQLTDRLDKSSGRVVLYISSLADGSGWDDTCQPVDRQVSRTDPQIGLWSAARWVSYNADRYGLGKSGENPGRADTQSYGLGMARSAIAQARACGMQGVFWAHDRELYDAGSGVGLPDYAGAIQ
jgi:hypothetical protein